jgi:serine/threonine-protein kinase
MSSTITLTLMRGEDVAGEYVFAEPKRCVVGRAADCDIRVPADLTYQDVSRRHCAFALDPPAVRVRDLGSLNGTRVNGVKIGQQENLQWADDSVEGTSPWVELYPGDEVRLGQLTALRVDVCPPEDAIRGIDNVNARAFGQGISHACDS